MTCARWQTRSSAAGSSRIRSTFFAVKTPLLETLSTAVPRILQVGLAGCFIGHGVFGVVTKAAWLPYFDVAGIGAADAWRLMPWVGVVDILIGLVVLARPFRALLAWASVWALWTALLRPFAGESWWEFFERAGNYGVPLAWLALVGWRGSWFGRLSFRIQDYMTTTRVSRLTWALRVFTASLLLGHGACGVMLHKAVLAQHYGFFCPSIARQMVPYIGGFECGLGILALTVPAPALFVALCSWKLVTEALFPLTGAPVWEFVERFGSYAVPLALAGVLWLSRRSSTATSLSSFPV